MLKKKGFTLIELVIVLILIGIVAAVAVPKFMDLQDETKKNAVKGALASVRSAINIYSAQKRIGGYTSYSSLYPQTENDLKNLMSYGKMPENPLNQNKSNVLITSTDAFGSGNAGYGWVYKNRTGEFWSAVVGQIFINCYYLERLSKDSLFILPQVIVGS